MFSRTAWVKVLIILTGLMFTSFVTLYVRNYDKIEMQQQFDSTCNDVIIRILSRLKSHEQILKAAAAYFEASDTVTREEWKNFVRNSEIHEKLPGIQGIGYSLIIPANRINDLVFRIKKEGYSSVSLKSEGGRDLTTSIIYIEPQDWRNMRALGYDMFSDPVRRKAMELARDSNMAVLSGKVKLVQETKNDIQPGTLMYVPVYKSNVSTNSFEERRSAIIGWVYSPYRMNDLIHGMLGTENIRQRFNIDFRIYDDSVSSERLLFDSNKDIINAYKTSESKEIFFNGKKWIIQISGNQGFTGIRLKETLIFLAGMLITILFFLLYRSTVNTARNAQLLARELTKHLSDSEEKFRKVVETLPSLLTIIDKNEKIIFISGNCEIFTGFRADEIPDTRIWWVHEDDHEFVSLVLSEACLLKNRARNFEYKARKKDGAVWYAHSSWEVLTDSTGEMEGVVIQTVDFTDTRLAEESLMASERKLRQINATKDMLFSVIAHDLRTPFTSILGFSELISESIKKEKYEKAMRFSNLIRSSAEQTLTLLENLLEWTRTQTGKIDFKPEFHLLGQVVRRITGIMEASAHIKNISLIDAISDDQILIYADLNMLEVILRNLISNAIKFTYLGGTVIITAGKREGSVEVIVEDNGIGLSSEKMQNILNPHSGITLGTANEKGSGLGLILCVEFIEKHGGILKVESIQGKGSKFIFALPDKELFGSCTVN
jgi:PAS domain S-box-containing protein